MKADALFVFARYASMGKSAASSQRTRLYLRTSLIHHRYKQTRAPNLLFFVQVEMFLIISSNVKFKVKLIKYVKLLYKSTQKNRCVIYI